MASGILSGSPGPLAGGPTSEMSGMLKHDNKTLEHWHTSRSAQTRVIGVSYDVIFKRTRRVVLKINKIQTWCYIYSSVVVEN